MGVGIHGGGGGVWGGRSDPEDTIASFKNIGIDQLMGQNLSNLVRMPKHAHNSPIFKN